MSKKMIAIATILVGILLVFSAFWVNSRNIVFRYNNDTKATSGFTTTTNHVTYGGDAYTGMQNAAADTANNVSAVNDNIEVVNDNIKILNKNICEYGHALNNQKETATNFYFFSLLAAGLLVILTGFSKLIDTKPASNKWLCENCNTKNNGKFCTKCGSLKSGTTD